MGKVCQMYSAFTLIILGLRKIYFYLFSLRPLSVCALFIYRRSLKYNPEVRVGPVAAIHDHNEKYIVAADKYFSETNELYLHASWK